MKKHVKPNPMKGTTGGVVDKTMPIHQSNVAIFNPATGKADRVGIKLLADPKTSKTTQGPRLQVAAAKRSRPERLRMAEATSKLLAGGSAAPRPKPSARLQAIYREKIVPDLMKKFGYKSVMQVPRITKITLNMGVSEAVADKKVMDNAVGDLTKIAGQKPVVTKSKKAIAGFKIRDGVPIGCMVTLRGVRMYEFLDRFVTIALPRVRDFRGISGRSFDGRGNYNIGVKEQIIFPEIDYDKIDALRGLNISITTTAKNDDECKALLPRSASRSRTEVTPVAKLSLIQREAKREQLVAKFAKKYAELKAIANDAKKSDEERYAARLELQKLPRNAYPTRLRNRCALTGPPARHVPQVRPGAQQDPRAGVQGRHPRCRQGQLVSGATGEIQ